MPETDEHTDPAEPTATDATDSGARSGIRDALGKQRQAGDVMAEALAVRRDALEMAEQIVSDAEQAATALEAEARSSSADTLARAKAEAQRIVGEAHERAQSMIEDARTVTQQTHDDADAAKREAERATAEGRAALLKMQEDAAQHRTDLLSAAKKDSDGVFGDIERLVGMLRSTLDQLGTQTTAAEDVLVRLKSDRQNRAAQAARSLSAPPPPPDHAPHDRLAADEPGAVEASSPDATTTVVASQAVARLAKAQPTTTKEGPITITWASPDHGEAEEETSPVWTRSQADDAGDDHKGRRFRSRRS